MRCLTLALALLERGWRPMLVGHMPADLGETARSAGVSVQSLPGELPLDAEPAYLRGSGLLDDVDVVITDHYGLAGSWQRAMAGDRRVLAAIDDLAASAMAVDLVLNQNLGASRERYRDLVAPDTVILAGPGYALLRPEFLALREGHEARTGHVRRILVFISGADEHDVTRRAAAAAAAMDAEVDVVVGSAYPFRDGLLAWAATHARVTVHVNTPDMAALMAAADLAIGAPSSASWERCTLALPSVLLILAGNQVEVARLLHEAGAAMVLGWHDQTTDDELAAAVRGLCADPARTRAMSKAAAGIADGRGAERVCDALEALLTLRSHPGPVTGAAP
jgi:UDP-2,4-diacetamido-2,4,6-trideoxy-beta-L-altropyranose hydrolase